MKIIKLLVLCFFISFESRSQISQNLFNLDNQGEIAIHPQAKDIVKVNIEEHKGENFLKFTCDETSWTPSVHFKTFTVVPGKNYTFLISAIPSDNMNAYINIAISVEKDLVWPGNKIEKGVTIQTFVIPEGVTTVSVGFNFVNPTSTAYLLVKDVGFFEGVIDPSQWIISENEGLQLGLRNSKVNLLWLIFPVSILFFVCLYYSDKKKGHLSEASR